MISLYEIDENKRLKGTFEPNHLSLKISFFFIKNSLLFLKVEFIFVSELNDFLMLCHSDKFIYDF